MSGPKLAEVPKPITNCASDSIATDPAIAANP